MALADMAEIPPCLHHIALKHFARYLKITKLFGKFVKDTDYISMHLQDYIVAV
jgi:hypothetical protein